MPQVSVIIVCMNRPDTLFPCLDSIRAHTKVSYEVLLVAYRFSEDNLQSVRMRYPWVSIIESMQIRGFAQNNNLALKEAKGRFCLVLNDDTLLEMPLIDALVEDFAMLPDNAAALSPALFYPDGRRQTCGRGPWTVWKYMCHYLGLLDETLTTEYSWREGLFKTYTLNGACFLIKTEIFREMGWFDETYFFTPEDIALGHLLNRSGYGVYADSAVRVIHIASASTSRMDPVLKPVRVRGALIQYPRSHFEYLLLGAFVWTYEFFRSVKYAVKRILGTMSERDVIMAASARNVRKNVFTNLAPGELFKKLTYEQLD